MPYRSVVVRGSSPETDGIRGGTRVRVGRTVRGTRVGVSRGVRVRVGRTVRVGTRVRVAIRIVGDVVGGCVAMRVARSVGVREA